MTIPSPNGVNGRNAKGRFAKGNPGGPGNPHAKQVGQLRSALLRAVTEEAVVSIITSMIEHAQHGNVAAAKFVFEYAFGTHGADLAQIEAEEADLKKMEIVKRLSREEVNDLLSR